MIVTCENCNTKFNLDETLIKETGSKVRCSKCRHIFTVYRPTQSEEPGPQAQSEKETFLEEPGAAGPAPEEKAEEEELGLEGFGLEEGPAAEGEEGEKEGVEEKVEEEVSLEGLGLEEEGAAGPAPEEKAEEEELGLEGFGLEEGPAAEGEEGEKEAVEEKVEEEVSLEELGLEEEAPIEEGPRITEKGEEPPTEPAVGGKPAESEEPVAEPPAEETIPPPISEKKPPEGKRISTPFLVLLIFVFVIGGAYGAYTVLKSFDIKIPFLESLTGAPESETIDPGNMHIALLEDQVSGRFADNKTAGRLFVIRGKVRNDYPAPRNFIKVKGALYLKDGKMARHQIAYCGNILSDTELETSDAAAIIKKLKNKAGDKKSNFRVPPGKVLPFMVVFSDLPQDLKEFTVEVVGSLPG